MTTTMEHTPRVQVTKKVPGFYRAMLAAAQESHQGMDPLLVELVQIRASQINHCARCIDMHTKDALKAGEDPERLHLIAAFDEATEHFTAKERAALALTEAVTVLTDGFVPDAVYERAAGHFDDDELARLVTVIAVINVWNRLLVTGRAVPARIG